MSSNTMTSLIRSTGQSIRSSACKSCHRTFSISQSRLADPTPTLPRSTPTPSGAATRPRSANGGDPDLSQLLARLTAGADRANAARPVRQNNNTRDLLTNLFTNERSKLQPAHTRNPNNAAMVDAARAVGYKRSQQEQLESAQLEGDLRRRLGRPWKEGDVYTPKDLGPREQRNWLRKKMMTKTTDVFELIGKKPTVFYRNFTVLSEFVSETGRIKHSNLTGLKRKNQNKIAKTIRRAIGLGLIPSVHAHPMLIQKKVGIDRL